MNLIIVRMDTILNDPNMLGIIFQNIRFDDLMNTSRINKLWKSVSVKVVMKWIETERLFKSGIINFAILFGSFEMMEKIDAYSHKFLWSYCDNRTIKYMRASNWFKILMNRQHSLEYIGKVMDIIEGVYLGYSEVCEMYYHCFSKCLNANRIDAFKWCIGRTFKAMALEWHEYSKLQMRYTLVSYVIESYKIILSYSRHIFTDEIETKEILDLINEEFVKVCFRTETKDRNVIEN